MHGLTNSAGGLDDLDSFLCFQWRLKFKTARNETEIFIRMHKPNLL